MSVSSPGDSPVREGFEIFGVSVVIGAPRQELLDRVIALLPPGLPRHEPETGDPHFVLEQDANHSWHYLAPRRRSPTYADLTFMIAMLEADLRRFVVAQTTKGVFVHAGTVAHRGRAIVIPGHSFSGKTTLVAELVRAGAEYYSDEYAIIDDQGLVHPYARPLSIRGPAREHRDSSPVESLGGTVGVEPVPVGLIAATSYRPEARFSPQRRSTAQGMLALLAHAGRARQRPGETVDAIRNAASNALVVEGERGEAPAAAQALLDLVDQAPPNGRPRPALKNARSDIGPHDVAFEVYGTRVRVAVPTAELADHAVQSFPFHAVRCEPRPGDRRFAVELAGDDIYSIVRDGVVRARIRKLDVALHRLRYELFYFATHHALDHLVVSAAAVGYEGRAIVLPGAQRAGKTVLQAALLRAGAVYYADDWVVLDAQGLVRPYPTTFKVDGKRVSAKDIGATVGEAPIPVALIARTDFKESARWNPRRLAPAEGAGILQGYAYGLDDPAAATRIAERAAASALVVEGDRGEAADTAAALLELAARTPAGDRSRPRWWRRWPRTSPRGAA